MLTRLLAVLMVFLGFSVLAAWAWDRSEANRPQAVHAITNAVAQLPDTTLPEQAQPR